MREEKGDPCEIVHPLTCCCRVLLRILLTNLMLVSRPVYAQTTWLSRIF